MKRILLFIVFVFLFSYSVVLAEETTTTINETTTTSIGKEVVLPLSFRINKWFWELRKKVTNNPIVKAKIDTQILEKENEVIDKMIENNTINVTDKVVTNFIQRKEAISNQLDKLKLEGQKVDDLISQIKTNTLNETSVLYKKLQNATEEQKTKIIQKLEQNKEKIQERIEVKNGILQNVKTDDEIKNLKEPVALKSEERVGIYNKLIELVKDKIVLMTENQKNHFLNYLRLRISKLVEEDITKIKNQITDGTIKVELENIIDKIINLNKPVVNIEIQEKKAELKNKIEEKNNKTKPSVLSPEEKQKLLNEVKEMKELYKEKNIQGPNTLQKPAEPIQKTMNILESIDQNTVKTTQ